MEGVIFDLKEFAVHDGPGVRQTVFFKGCPLRCNWCHNPEGLSIIPQLMVSDALCSGCGNCKQVCLHPEACIACGDCIEVCPGGARKICGERLSSTQLVKRIRKNSDYYAKLGGGLTFSGGEPLMQPDFLEETLQSLRDVHCAIETCGYAQPMLFQRIIRQFQYVMLDIKLVDNALHQKYTGKENDLILQNLEWLCGQEIPFVVRIPLIPGVNDTGDHYRETALRLKNAHHLQQVELLPYHKTAGAKYQMIGKEYTPQFDVESAVKISHREFMEQGIRSVVL